MPGAGQNMYIYPSILGAFGGKWFDAGGKIRACQIHPGGKLVGQRHADRHAFAMHEPA